MCCYNNKNSIVNAAKLNETKLNNVLVHYTNELASGSLCRDTESVCRQIHCLILLL